jgi:hypothetical protein
MQAAQWTSKLSYEAEKRRSFFWTFAIVAKRLPGELRALGWRSWREGGRGDFDGNGTGDIALVFRRRRVGEAACVCQDTM